MKHLMIISVLAITLLFSGNGFSQSMPAPNIPKGCNDNPWPATGHWAMLQEGQYGAESLDKLEKGYKWKIAKRVQDQIIPIWCGYFNEAATTEQLNAMYASGKEKFIKIPIRDSGKFKTTGFWLYK